MRLSIFVFFAFLQVANAQTDSLAVIYGTLKDTLGAPLIGATLKILKNGEFVKGTITDFDGNYRVQIVPGKYDLEIRYPLFVDVLIKDVSLIGGQILKNDVELRLEKHVIIDVYILFKTPLIDFDPVNTGNIITSDQIRKMY